MSTSKPTGLPFHDVDRHESAHDVEWAGDPRFAPYPLPDATGFALQSDQHTNDGSDEWNGDARCRGTLLQRMGSLG